MPQSVGVQLSAPVLKLAVFVQHKDDPVHFARTLLTVTLKQIHHFKCKQSAIAAAITMPTDFFGRTHLFFRNTDPSVSFLKKQPRVSALCWNCSQESPQAHFFIDISSNWRQFCSFGSNFCVFNHIFSSKIISKTRKSD